MTPDGFPVVGIVGGGQLARMMIQAAIPLGIGVRLLAERADDSAARVCPEVDLGSPDDPDALLAFARTVDVVTLDHELVDLDALEGIDRTIYRRAPDSRAGFDLQPNHGGGSLRWFVRW